MELGFNIREVWDYNPETGAFTWKVDRYYGGCLRAKRGSKVGSVDNSGYFRHQIWFEGKMYRFLLHRLAFYFMENEFLPKEVHVDHINRIKTDNRWINLRKATQDQNVGNIPPLPGCKSRYKGVGLKVKERVWQARITVNGKRCSLGLYKSEKDAAIAYNEVAKLRWGEFAWLNPIKYSKKDLKRIEPILGPRLKKIVF